MYKLRVQLIRKNEPADMGMRYAKTPRHGDVIKIDAERRRVRARVVTIRTKPAEFSGATAIEEITAVEDFVRPGLGDQLLTWLVAQLGLLNNLAPLQARRLGAPLLAGLV